MPSLTPHTRQLTMVCISAVMLLCVFKGEMIFANSLLIFAAAIFNIKGE